ncbi:MAG: hypothetical protein NTX52_04740 [Planctomycetota bacterium]|nr:hypothetical protein [Planctomycetota bacterium]
METSRNFFAQILFVLFVFVYSVYGVVPSGDMFTIGGSGSVGTDQGLGCIFDAAGYSDGIYYGQTDIHNFGLHEVLSGEWGAAVYYDGINTSPTKDPNDPPDRRQAMWLTDMFVYPSWGTRLSSGHRWIFMSQTRLFLQLFTATGMFCCRHILFAISTPIRR